MVTYEYIMIWKLFTNIDIISPTLDNDECIPH